MELRDLDFANVFGGVVTELAEPTIDDSAIAELAQTHFHKEMTSEEKVSAWKTITRDLRAQGHSAKRVASVLKRLGCRSKKGPEDTDKLVAKVMAQAKYEHRKACAEQVCGIDLSDAKASVLNALFAGKSEFKSGKKTINVPHTLALPAYAGHLRNLSYIDSRGKELHEKCKALQVVADTRELTTDEQTEYDTAYESLQECFQTRAEAIALWRTTFDDIVARIATMHSAAFPATRGRGASTDLDLVQFDDAELMDLLEEIEIE